MSNSEIVRPEIKRSTYNEVLVLAGIKIGDRPSLEIALQNILKTVEMTPSESKRMNSIVGERKEKSSMEFEGGTHD